MNNRINSCLKMLSTNLKLEKTPPVLSFKDYLALVCEQPRRLLRNIFQVFCDMIFEYVGEGVDEYPNDPESIGFRKYDCSKLFVDGFSKPFFPDRLFANRFIAQIKHLQYGKSQNRMYIYKGPAGSGKSTFLTNLLTKFEDYTKTPNGQMFEICWDIELGGEKLTLPCPSHDHPFLLIPREQRSKFLKKLLPPSQDKEFILTDSSYEWLFEDEVCPICSAIFEALLEKLSSIEEIFQMVKVRPYKFSRQLGQGISVFNPADESPNGNFLSNSQIQEKLDRLLGPGTVKYIYSPLAAVNNGIYVLMDIKGKNLERFGQLHNVLSEGIWKVGGLVEEKAKRIIFLGTINPEDEKVVTESSLKDRVIIERIHYILEPATEVRTYASVYGKDIEKRFLPNVLENFARVVISTRLKLESPAIKEWISDLSRYDEYCDSNGLLLRMEIYSGIIPLWLSEEDRKRFNSKIRSKIIAEAATNGESGWSGRESIALFGEFLELYRDQKFITMDQVVNFFKKRISKEARDRIPQGFLGSLARWYDYQVLDQAKLAAYRLNEEYVRREILDFLYAINFNVGDKIVCPYTGDEVSVTQEFFSKIVSLITGVRQPPLDKIKSIVEECRKKCLVIVARGEDLATSEIFREIFESYVSNLKEMAIDNIRGVREGIAAFGTPDYPSLGEEVKLETERIIGNMVSKFHYPAAIAAQILLYAIDKASDK